MSIINIFNEVISLSGRDDLDSPEGKIAFLGYVNRYKLYLQRDKRICFSESTIDLELTINTRITDLPSDFLFPVAIRRLTPGITAETFNIEGDRFQIIKRVILKRWLNKEEFLTRFPVNRSNGELLVGAPNDYLYFGQTIIWGPTPNADETLKLDYFALLPKYDLVNVIDDEFTLYYNDGLLYQALEQVFTSWIPDTGKKNMWMGEKRIVEAGLRKYQVSREEPMESTLELPDL